MDKEKIVGNKIILPTLLFFLNIGLFTLMANIGFSDVSKGVKVIVALGYGISISLNLGTGMAIGMLYKELENEPKSNL